jgi:hypothetical protein
VHRRGLQWYIEPPACTLTGASFITTFFVLPKLYTRNTDWKEMLPELRASGLRSITPREAYAKSRSAVLLDVRLPERFAEGAPARAINVPLYLPIANWCVHVWCALSGVFDSSCPAHDLYTTQGSPIHPAPHRVCVLWRGWHRCKRWVELMRFCHAMTVDNYRCVWLSAKPAHLQPPRPRTLLLCRAQPAVH